ncbi:MAG: hypothetical protein ACXVIG_08395 [Halobacteriota archaeon]
MKHEENLLERVNVSDLTYVFDDAQDIGLAKIVFTVTQEANDGQMTGRQDAPEAYYVSGTLDPKDIDGAYKLLQQALDNKPFAVYGRFKNTDNGDEAEWQLTNVLFDHVAPGRLSDWTFRARASKR